MLEYLIICIFVVIFGLQHSGLSSLRVKNKIIDRWGKAGYARVFNISSALTLLFAFLAMGYWDWLYFLISPELIQPFLFGSGIVLIVIGGYVSNLAAKVISVSTVADMRTDRKAELIKDGIYSKLRHPLYLATILMLFGLILLYPFGNVIIFSLGLIIYTIIGAYLEERKLIVHYGQDYIDYKKQAGFLIPKL